MSLELVRSAPEPVLVLDPDRQRTTAILEAWRAGKSPHTLRSYEHDLETFAAFLTRPIGTLPALTIEAALTRLFEQDSATALTSGSRSGRPRRRDCD